MYTFFPSLPTDQSPLIIAEFILFLSFVLIYLKSLSFYTLLHIFQVHYLAWVWLPTTIATHDIFQSPAIFLPISPQYLKNYGNFSFLFLPAFSFLKWFYFFFDTRRFSVPIFIVSRIKPSWHFVSSFFFCDLFVFHFYTDFLHFTTTVNLFTLSCITRNKTEPSLFVSLQNQTTCFF